MKTLGISCFYHDSAAALLDGSTIEAAAQEERFSRVKYDRSFPNQAVSYCLRETETSLDELRGVVFYEKPVRKFERYLDSFAKNHPNGKEEFVESIDEWADKKLFMREKILEDLNDLSRGSIGSDSIYFSEHHLSHAASAYYPSPFEKAAILTVDGVGEWDTSGIFEGEGNEVKKIKSLKFPDSVGLFYSAFTYFLGFRVNSGEYKMMGLAPFGGEDEVISEYKEKITDEIVSIHEDGSISLNSKYFTYEADEKIIPEGPWEDLLDIQRRDPESEFGKDHANVAKAVQEITEEIITKLARRAKQLTGKSKLCMAGGVALNCVANGKLHRSGLFEDIWIQPAAGDAGGALGAAYALQHMGFGEGTSEHTEDSMQGTFLGPAYDSNDYEQTASRFSAPYEKYTDFDDLTGDVAELLGEGNVIGWFQGRMEWGPRALGHRSILGDPRNPEMQKTLNQKIKFREGFRPFAPSVLEEDQQEYFTREKPAPYMLFVTEVQEDKRKPLPPNYNELTISKQLETEKSDVPAITHVDFSSRLQTVNQDDHPKYWQLLKAFKNLTGVGMVVNTSFNLRGEPIVRTPKDAYVCFMRSNMDYLVLGNYLFDKQDQPEWHETREEWRAKIALD
jgi:carbamoyltransferase